MPSTRSIALPWPHLGLFAAFATATVGVATLIALRLPTLPSPDALALGVSLDLVLLPPLAYVLILARGAGWPPMLAVPLGLGGLALAAALLPEAHPGAVPWLLRALPLVEVVIIGVVGMRAVRTARSVRAACADASAADLPRHLRDAFRELLPFRFAADATASEVAVAYYATAGLRRPAHAPGTFGYARNTAALYAAFGLALFVETVALHIVLALFVSEPLAWVLTAFSAYSIVWLLADARAVRHRPIAFGADAEGAPILHLREGIRWDATVPLAHAKLFRLDRAGALPKHNGTLDITLLRRATHVIEVAEPIDLIGPVGLRKKARRVRFAVDDPDAFEAAFRDVMR